MFTISHRKPEHKGFWPIVLPYTGDPLCEKSSFANDDLKQVTLKDPKTGEETMYDIHDVWRLDTHEGYLGDAFSKLTYGISSKKLMNYLQKRYPDWDGHQVEFILIKEHE